VHRLVCSGYARPGQTGWGLLDSLALDVVLDVAFTEIITGSQHEEARQLVSEQLDEIDAVQPPLVEVTKSDGTVIQISEARLAQIRRNAGARGRLTKPRKPEKQEGPR
jgi:hypothetical protein